jgi:hypothetical protein
MILDSNFSEPFNSPFIVPVASFIMVLGIVAVGAWSNARKRELESQERLAAIAKGLVLPPTAAEIAATQGRPAVSLVRRRANIRLAGIVLLGAAGGIALFFIALASILHERDVLCGAACALIPFGIGVGFLIDTRIQSREIDESTPAPTNHSFTS